jgi:hypothetical protein
MKKKKRQRERTKYQKVSKAQKADGRGARLGVSMNHKVKLHGVRKYTQDQPGVEDGKQKHHNWTPWCKNRGNAKENSKKIAKD